MACSGLKQDKSVRGSSVANTLMAPLQGAVDHENLPTAAAVGDGMKESRPLGSKADRHHSDDNAADTIKTCDAARSQLSVHSNFASDAFIRQRYLHRLGIHAGSSQHNDDIGSRSQHRRTSANDGSCSKLTSCSAPAKMSYMRKSSHHSLSQSSSHGDMTASTLSVSSHQQQACSNQDIILLKRSVQYTTQLKPDTTSRTSEGDEPSSSLPLATSSKEGETTVKPSTSPSSSKFELSSAWASLLHEETASTGSASSGAVDGAYEIFSLPSDSSMAASRCGSTKSLDCAALERLPSRDSLSASSMPRRRKVSFDSTVKAVNIPSRLSYSNRIRTRLWSSTEDIYANALRNEREYAFDGSNWRTAREEGDFLRCSPSSQSSAEDVLVHPVHFTCWSPPQKQNEQTPKPAAPSSTLQTSESQASDDNIDDAGVFDMD